ncbi:MAG: PsbP-related protein [Candidatus Levybacteria bacterium]|nr:PsbP-related protein [Candidatus Levybacteria bacterium]
MENSASQQNSEQLPQQLTAPSNIPSKPRKFIFILAALVILIILIIPIPFRQTDLCGFNCGKVSVPLWKIGWSYFLGIGSLIIKTDGRAVRVDPSLIPDQRITSSPTPTVDETANWKTYENRELSYSIKLPNDWNLSKELSIKQREDSLEKFTPLSENEVSEISKQDAYNPSFYLEIEVKDNQGININEWASNSKYSPQAADQEITETLLNGISSVQVLGNQGKGFVDYYLYNEKKIYNVGYYYLENDPTWGRPSGITKEIFEKIISTFKFTPASPSQGGDQNQTTDTSGWKTYTNGKHGYSFNYPLNWQITGTVFYDENNQKIAETELPGLIFLEPNEKCLDYLNRDIEKNKNSINSYGEIISKQAFLLGKFEAARIVTKRDTESRKYPTWYPNIYCISKDNKGFIMYFYERMLNSGKSSLFNQILSTFQFTN